jgi:hypothetical protein
VIEAALDKAVAMLRTPTNSVPDRNRVSKRLRDVETTLANLTDTAAKGGAVPAVLEALNRADTERRVLESELAALKVTRGAQPEPLDARALRRTLRGYLDDWTALINGNITQARELLQLVLRDRITFTPKSGSKGEPMYELKIPIAFDRLIVSVVPGLARVGLASPTGPSDGRLPMTGWSDLKEAA